MKGEQTPQTTGPYRPAEEIAADMRRNGARKWRRPLEPLERLRLMLAMVEADARDGDIDGARETLRQADELIRQLPKDSANAG